MRNILLIILASVHFFGNTEISQVFKVPNLINHYFEHCRLNPGMSFFQFLSMHYGGDDGTNADNDKDDQLPCHNLHHNTLSVVCFKIQEAASIDILSSDRTDGYVMPLLTYHPQEHIFSFFKPPRTA
jgi:hypothetical protein